MTSRSKNLVNFFRFLVLKILQKFSNQLKSENLAETEKGILQVEKFVRSENFENVTKKQIKYLPKSCILQTENKTGKPAANKRFGVSRGVFSRKVGFLASKI